MDILIDIEKEFADIVCKKYEGTLTHADIREVVKFLFGSGVIDRRKAKIEVIRAQYFKLIKQGESAQEAKMILAINYDSTFESVKKYIYNYT